VNKTKIKTLVQEETAEDLPFAPPEVRYLSERYIVELPVSDNHFGNPWELRVHVAKILERHLGDEVQLTSMKIKKPHLLSKTKARFKKQEPCARLYVTVKF
jgi:hypothetical protein